MLKMMLALVLPISNQDIKGEESCNKKSVTSEI